MPRTISPDTSVRFLVKLEVWFTVILYFPYPFDSASTEVPEQVKKAAFALDVNGVSDVISVTGTQAYSSQYYIVKLIKKTEKSSNIDDYKEKLKTVILTQKQNDSTFVQSIIGKELQAANIKVKDQAFQNIFTQYIGGGDSSSSSSTSNE